MRAKQPVSPVRHDDLRATLAISALSRQLESIDRQLDDIAHIEAAHAED